MVSTMSDKECPEEDCERNLRVVTHERDPQFDTEPAGPVKEVFCVTHGIQASK